MNGFDAIVWLARVGFLVKGVLYMVIGALALQVAAKAGGRVTGTRGALTTVLGQPFGRTLLLVVVVGLLSYATGRILQGLLDPDRLGNNWRGLAIRASFVARGWASAASAWRHAPVSLRCSDGQSSLPVGPAIRRKSAPRRRHRTLAAQPGGLGRWLLGGTAAGFVAYGFYEIIHARYLQIRRVR